jgi:hypothetical protein
MSTPQTVLLSDTLGCPSLRRNRPWANARIYPDHDPSNRLTEMLRGTSLPAEKERQLVRLVRWALSQDANTNDVIRRIHAVARRLQAEGAGRGSLDPKTWLRWIAHELWRTRKDRS